MPSIRDENTVKAIAREYIRLDRNKAGALVSEAVGYSRSFAYSGKGTKLYENIALKDEIARIEAEIADKIDHDRDKAIAILHEALAIARTDKSSAGIVQACRELDAISNLHSSTLHNTAEPIDIADEDRAELKAAASRAIAIKLSKPEGSAAGPPVASVRKQA